MGSDAGPGGSRKRGGATGQKGTRIVSLHLTLRSEGGAGLQGAGWEILPLQLLLSLMPRICLPFYDHLCAWREGQRQLSGSVTSTEARGAQNKLFLKNCEGRSRGGGKTPASPRCSFLSEVPQALLPPQAALQEPWAPQTAQALGTLVGGSGAPKGFWARGLLRAPLRAPWRPDLLASMAISQGALPGLFSGERSLGVVEGWLSSLHFVKGA